MGRHFEDLEVWKAGCRLAVAVCEAMRDCANFALRDQATRAALSIPSNIAEGSERSSQKEFFRFLDIAKGSAAELRTQLYILSKLKLINTEQTTHMLTEAKSISRMLQSLQNSLRSSPNTTD